MSFANQQRTIKCHAVVAGECWLAVDGAAKPVRLATGHCFVLPKGRDFRLATDLNLEPVDSARIFGSAREGGVVSHNGGGEFYLVGSRFEVSGIHASILLEMMPLIVHVSKKADQEVIRWSVERMMAEMRDQNPGGRLVVQHLSRMMLLQALRLHLAELPAGGVGWLCALADTQIGPVINSLHKDPARAWTLHELAALARMSRSGFALRFKEVVGVSPMDYLTRWRMLLAGDRLGASKEPIAEIAASLGYESESGFSNAFKRVMGSSPREYGRNHTTHMLG